MTEDKRMNASVPTDERILDTVVDGIDRMQEDGGVAPQISHRKAAALLAQQSPVDTPRPN